MASRKVTEQLSVSPQIDVDDVAAISAAGFRSILCNRPDGEEPGQPAFEAIEAAAKTAGLEVHYQPVHPGGLDQGDVEAFAALADKLPAPILAYCRSGTRCITLWALAETKKRPLADVLEMAKAAGYNLGGP